MSLFDSVPEAPPIEVFELTRSFNNDTHTKKVNLGVGAYRTDEGKPWVLPVVHRVERLLAEDDTQNHEYLPVLGHAQFCDLVSRLLLGAQLHHTLTGVCGDGCDPARTPDGRVVCVQTLSGTGALSTGALLLCRLLHVRTCYVSVPSWANHRLVFETAGFGACHSYRYWDAGALALDFDGLCADLEAASEGAAVVLHACAHNPTGCDLTREQWERVADIVQLRRLVPFFDLAYQGFASGDPDHDAWPVRMFAERGIELLCAQSFSKNFGLYNERVGALTVVMSNAHQVDAVRSQLTLLVRATYSNPPAHGARIVATILGNNALRNEWQSHIREMSERVKLMRQRLRERLVCLGTPTCSQTSTRWQHIVDQIGMFSYTGLTCEQCRHLVEHFHIYLLRSGRINMAGLNSSNLEYVAKAIDHTVRAVPYC